MRSSAVQAALSRAIGILIIALFVVAILGCAEHPPAPETYSSSWKHQCYRAFAGDVNDLVGADALDCGMVHPDDGNRTQARKQGCARRAVASGKPFKFGYIGAGDDSLFCHVAGRSEDGQLWNVFVDFDMTGQNETYGSNSSLSISRCDRIEFEPGTIYKGRFFDLSECKAAPDMVERYVQEKEG